MIWPLTEMVKSSIGIGLAKEFHDNMFQIYIFKRPHGQEKPGTGIGLGYLQKDRRAVRGEDMGDIEIYEGSTLLPEDNNR